MTPERYRRLSGLLDRRQPDLTVLLDDLQKPHNVSAVMRTCDAVGVGRIHGVTDAESFRVRAAASAGVARYVEVVLHPSRAAAADALHEEGFEIWAADKTSASVDYREVDYTRKICLVLGQEKRGVDPDLLDRADGTLFVPMHGVVESLNVSVANAVVLYEAERQRSQAGLYETPRLPDAVRQHHLFEWGYRRMAQRCRERGLPYPALGPEGELLSDPFA